MGKGQTSELCGRAVLVPARVWPDLQPPKGERGWEGQIKRVKKGKAGEEYIVKFPGDVTQYYFPKSDVLSWLLPEQPKPAAQPKPTAAASGKASGAAGGSKKRAAEDKPSGSGRASPAKKPAGPAARAGVPQSPSALLAAAAAPSPGKSGGRASPSKAPKVTKESLLADLDKLMHRMDTQQMAQLVQEARRILS